MNILPVGVLFIVVVAIGLVIVFRIPAFRKWWQEAEEDWHKALLESQLEQIKNHKIREEE